jgi:hypothetical protein
MARTKPYLAPVNQGEVSLVALARVDIQRMQGALELGENVVALVEGALRFRPGTIYSGINTLGNLKARLMAFQASSTLTAILELTANTMRVIVNGVAVERPSVATAWVNPDFAAGVAPWASVTDAGCSLLAPGTGLVMTATKLGRCQISRTMTVASIGVEHALRIVLSRHPLRLRIGTTATNDDIIQTTLIPGAHSIAFTPSVGTVYISVQTIEPGACILSEVRLEGAGAMQLPTVWGLGDLPRLRTDQSADVIFCVDGIHPPQRIERRSMRSWSVTEYSSPRGPFTNERPANVTMTPTGIIGEILLNSSAPYFRPTSVGQILELNHSEQNVSMRLYAAGHASDPIRITGFGSQRAFGFSVTSLTGTGTTVTLERATAAEGPFNDWNPTVHNYTVDTTSSLTDGLDGRDIYYRLAIRSLGYSSGSPIVTLGTTSGSQRGIVKVTAYVNPTQVQAEVIETIGSLTATDDWRPGEWSNDRGWPGSVALHDGRLFLARSDQEFGSVSDDYSNFDQSTTGDEGPIIRRIGAGPVEGSLWMVSLQRLLNGMTASVRSIRSSSFDSPLTPTAYLGRDVTTKGTAPISPLKLDTSAVYVSKDYRRILELAYSVDANDYVAGNLTRLSRDILGGRQVVDLAVQRHPETRLWFVLDDGTARILSYDKDEQVTAWTRFVTDGVIETVTTIPSAAGSELWMVVRRNIGGTDVRMIERAAFEHEADGANLTVMTDASIVYSGSPTFVIAGMSHLEGEQVAVWADGAALFDADNPMTVSGGQITIPEAKSNVVVGLPYRARIKGAKAAFGGQMGTAIGQRKQGNALSLLLVRTAIGGIRVGSDFDSMGRLNEVVRGRTIDVTRAIESYDIDPQVFPTWADPDWRLHMTMMSPYPATIAGTMLDVLTHES